MKKYTRKELVQLSSLYYRCEKYDLMIQCAKQLIEDNPILNPNEKNVLYEGYKFKLTKAKKSIIKLIEIELKEKKRKSSKVQYIKEVLNPVIKEYIETVDDFKKQLEIVTPKAATFDDMVYYNTLLCDCIRYKCHFMKKKELEDETDKFNEIYLQSMKLCKEFLTKNNVNYLKLILTKCVFDFEILNKKEDASKLARETYNMVKQMKEVENKEVKEILRLLKDNIIIWSGKCEADVII